MQVTPAHRATRDLEYHIRRLADLGPRDNAHLDGVLAHPAQGLHGLATGIWSAVRRYVLRSDGVVVVTAEDLLDHARCL